MNARSLVEKATRFTPPGESLPAATHTTDVVRASPQAAMVVRTDRRRGPPVWALRIMRTKTPRRLATLFLALVCLALIVAVSGIRMARGDVGTVAVVRNGGPLDGRTIRQIILPGQPLTFAGMFSQSPHEYPAAHVTVKYTVTGQSASRRSAAEGSIALPTKDGVQIGLEAAVFLRFVGDSNLETLRRFDLGPGTRRFPGPDGTLLYPWEGPEGFSAMLDALFRPVLENALRKEIGRFDCSSLVSSCSLLHGGRQNVRATDENIAGIEESINSSLEDDLHKALGQPYFWDIRFRVGRVTLPTKVQGAIDEAEANFAEVNTARAQLQEAEYIARRNRLLGATYNHSAGLTTIEALKAIPKGSTVILSMNGRVPMVLAGGQSAAAAASPAAPDDAPGSTGRPGRSSGGGEPDDPDAPRE
jgi:regulator of protease activity HflC (stomatin/prohibitin superfamily)